MMGFRGQIIDWKGKNGGWYVLLADAGGLQMSVRLTAPLADEFPDRQLITGFALKYQNGHSIVMETKEPYTTETGGCPRNLNGPCLSEHALKITVDGEPHLDVPSENVLLSGGAVLTAFNLPAECQPYGGDVVWAHNFAKIMDHRRLSAEVNPAEWVGGWSETTAAPSWCNKFLSESGAEGLLNYCSKHSVFNIETNEVTVRLHHGTNHQGGEALEDGRVLPVLEFWQMDVHLEWFDLNTDTVTGILGETMRPVLSESGQPIMSGSAAMRGDVEDYRISGPLASFSTGLHE